MAIKAISPTAPIPSHIAVLEPTAAPVAALTGQSGSPGQTVGPIAIVPPPAIVGKLITPPEVSVESS
jgi:hypothetical protein